RAARPVEVDLGRGDDDRDHRGVAHEMADRFGQDGRAAEPDELLGQAGAEARSHATRRDDDRQLQALRPVRHQPRSAVNASPTVATPRMSSDALAGSRTLLRGTMARRKPTAAAPRRRSSSPAPARTSPVRPTSPTTSTSGGTARSM